MTSKRNSSNLKAIGIFLIIYGIIYLLFGTLALTGAISNTLPAHENQEILVVTLAYINGLLPVITGIACQKSNITLTLILSFILTVLSIISLIYLYTSHQTPGIFDSLGIGFGIGSFIYAIRAKADL